MLLSTLITLGLNIWAYSHIQYSTVETAPQPPIKTSVEIEQMFKESIPDVVMLGNNVLYSDQLGIAIKGDFAAVEYKENVFSVGYSGIVEVLPKQGDENVPTTIRKLLIAKGYNPDECIIEKVDTEYQSEGVPLNNATWMISPKKSNSPTEEEVFEYRQKQNPLLTRDTHNQECAEGPTCEWDKDKLIWEQDAKICSQYIKLQGKDRSFFQAKSDEKGTTMAYVRTYGSGGGFSWIESVDVKK